MIKQKFAELERAAQEFKAALLKFESVYDPERVDIDKACDYIDEIVFDIEQELVDNDYR